MAIKSRRRKTRRDDKKNLSGGSKKISSAPLLMPVTEFEDDDEDWYDGDSDDPDDESVPCPECGHDVYVITGKCPSCGYWLTDADRRAGYPSESKPFWMRVTAIVVLFAMLASIMIGLAAGVF